MPVKSRGQVGGGGEGKGRLSIFREGSFCKAKFDIRLLHSIIDSVACTGRVRYLQPVADLVNPVPECRQVHRPLAPHQLVGSLCLEVGIDLRNQAFPLTFCDYSVMYSAVA